MIQRVWDVRLLKGISGPRMCSDGQEQTQRVNQPSELPPHRPFDATVLQKVPGSRDMRWTQITTKSEYLKVVTLARIAAKGRALARWELDLYNSSVRSLEP